MSKALIKIILSAVLVVSMLAGCGGPDADVTVFVMTQPAPSGDAVKQMEAALQSAMGEKKVRIVSSPLFSMEKLLVEVAAGGHGVFIVNKQPMEAFANQGAYVPLDDTFSPEDFPEGVIEMTDLNAEGGEVKTKGLYTLPIDKTAWFQISGYNGETAYAYVPVNAPDQQLSKQVLKAMVDWKPGS
jgi:hypothetical protein